MGELHAVVERWGQSFNDGDSFLLMKRDGAWMIAHQHSSILPKPAGG